MKLDDPSSVTSLSAGTCHCAFGNVAAAVNLLTLLFSSRMPIKKFFKFLFWGRNALCVGVQVESLQTVYYSTFHKWFIESEILASLYQSAGGWSTQPSLCAHWHCSLVMGSTCYIPAQICLYYESLRAKLLFSHHFTCTLLISCHFRACMVIKNMCSLSVPSRLQSQPVPVNHSVNTHEQVAGSLSPTMSHSPIVLDERDRACVCVFDYILHLYLPRRLKAGDRLTDIKTRRSEESHPSQGTPFWTDPSLCSCLLWSQVIHALCTTPELPYINILLVVFLGSQ